MRVPLAALAFLLALGPALWTVALPPDGRISARPVAIMLSSRVLHYLGGWALAARDRRFGGFSALAPDGTGMVLLSDAGWTLRLPRGAWRDVAAGGDKASRDSESLAHDPATGRWWIGFEGNNLIARLARGLVRTEAAVRPRAMRRWPVNGGAESLARLTDGRFVVIAEKARTDAGARRALLFPDDPTTGARPIVFAYRPPAGMDPSDAAALPDGRLLVLDRKLGWAGFEAALSLVDVRSVRAGTTVTGRVLARLRADNLEGVAVGREGGRTIVWLLSDDNFLPVQRTLLLRFALALPERH